MNETRPVPRDAPGAYTIIWKFMPNGWAEGVSPEPAPGTMPFFVDGEAYARLQRKESVPLTAYGLLCGILLSWFEPARFGAGSEQQLRRFLHDMLRSLQDELAMESLEAMVLGAAARLREDHGPLLASRALTGGHNVLPDSSPIRADLMTDVWTCLETLDNVDRQSAFGFLVRVYRGIDFTAVDGRAVQLLDYMHLVALRLSGETEAAARFFWETGAKRIRNPYLRHQAITLVGDADPDFDDYRIWHEAGDR